MACRFPLWLDKIFNQPGAVFTQSSNLISTFNNFGDIIRLVAILRIELIEAAHCTK